MREIKFRGQDINGEWHKGLLCIVNNEHFISNKMGSPKAYLIIPKTIGQFTGLKDKNGKEIYEGDIIQNGVFIGEVFYNPDFDLSGNACAFMIRNRYKIYSFHKMLVDFGMSNLEIIGNIYENPNLLKNGKV